MKNIFFFLVLLAGAMSVRAEDGGMFRFNNRMVEYAITADVGVANNFFKLSDFFQKTIEIDLTKLNKDLKFDMDAVISPFNINFNWKDRWGFSIFVNTEVSGNMLIPVNMLTLSQAQEDEIGFGAAVFAEGGGSAFFHVGKFKFKAKGALFMPIFYAQPNISYTNEAGEDSTDISIKYDMKVFTAFPMESGVPFGLTGTFGFDLGAGVEYPLFPILDLGVDLTHIPLVPATLKDYMSLNGEFALSLDKDFLEGEINFDDMLSTPDIDTTYGAGRINVLRPFKLLTWAEFRPFYTRLFSVIGVFGFSVNPLYSSPGSVEIGAKVRSDVANIVIATLGIGYEDRLWKNGIDLVINARAVEFDLGIDMRSHNFAKSWTAGGVGVRFGLRMGW